MCALISRSIAISQSSASAALRRVRAWPQRHGLPGVAILMTPPLAMERRPAGLLCGADSAMLEAISPK